MDLNQLGPYRVTGKLGEGAMGAVYKGVNEETGEVAALKLLAHQLAHQEGFRVRFEAEIETLRRLEHPNIVHCLGFGEQNGMLFYAMEFVEGTSLSDEQKAGRTFEWRQVVQYSIQMCAALKHAHDRGIIHRDLKPANLMLMPDATIKLADFGIARLYGHTGMTMAGSPIGTASYMSPEQALGETVTERADLYSVGCTIYALLAGRAPFVASSLAAMIQAHLNKVPEPLSSFAPDVPEELDLIVAKLLEKKVEDRIPTAATLSRSLQGVIAAVALRDSTRSTPATPVVPVPPDNMVGHDDPTRLPSRSQVAQQHPSTDETLASPTVPGGGTYELADDNETVKESFAETKPDSTVHLDGETQPSIVPVEQSGDDDTASSIYITADEARRREREARRERESLHPRIISSGAVWAGVFVIAMGIAISFFMKPPSADKLNRNIQNLLSEGSNDDIEKAETYIMELARLYPDDPRLTEYETVREEARFLRLERKMKAQARIRLSKVPASPIERNYLEAISHEDTNPELCVIKLNAILDLYSDASITKDEKMLDYLTLTRRTAARLQEKINTYAGEHKLMLAGLINRAASLRETNPEASARICRSVIELYDDKTWARELVDKARAMLTP